MNRLLLLLAFAPCCPLALAQETYWVGNRFSNDVHEVSVLGTVVRSVAVGTSVRGAHVAPNGKVWITPFGGALRILDPATGIVTSHAFTFGTPFDVAFDAQGIAWAAGGSGVEAYDAAGNSVGTFPLPAAAALGITIDSQGNKWIAHRTGIPPGSVSRIDGTTGAVTGHPMPGTSLILPTRTYADFRGVLQPSHVWVVGDNRGAGELIELDSTGAVLNTYVLGASAQLGTIAEDLAGNLYVGDFATGAIHKVDRNTGVVLLTFPGSPVLGLAMDGFGNLWTTARLGNSTASPPSEVRRIHTGTGVIEVAAVVGIGTSWPLSTRFQHALVVAPLGDQDGDGQANFAEVFGGDSPFDPCSHGGITFTTRGETRTGGVMSLDFGPAAFLFGFSGGRVAPGSGLVLPGVGCELLLDLTLLYPATMFVLGPTSIPLTVPLDPGLVGTTVYMQAIGNNGATSTFTNLTGAQVWM